MIWDTARAREKRDAWLSGSKNELTIDRLTLGHIRSRLFLLGAHRAE